MIMIDNYIKLIYVSLSNNQYIRFLKYLLEFHFSNLLYFACNNYVHISALWVWRSFLRHTILVHFYVLLGLKVIFLSFCRTVFVHIFALWVSRGALPAWTRRASMFGNHFTFIHRSRRRANQSHTWEFNFTLRMLSLLFIFLQIEVQFLSFLYQTRQMTEYAIVNWN